MFNFQTTIREPNIYIKGMIVMARKNEGWFDLLVVLPWWVSVIVSALAYIGLNYIAPSIIVDNMFLQPMLKALPSLSPIIPLVLLFPAPISAFTAWRKRKLVDDQKGIQTIRDLSWREFEELVAEAYRRQNYMVIENTNTGADGGIDVRLKKDGRTHLVQCKNWKTSKVGVKVIREMYGVMTAEHASSVIIIISGVFTQEAKDFATGKPIDLVDGAQLEKLIANVQVASTKVAPVITKLFNSINDQNKACPKCSSILVLRTAKKGMNTGGQFWGCSAYPKCRHTESV
jgi:restriction system protein